MEDISVFYVFSTEATNSGVTLFLAFYTSPLQVTSEPYVAFGDAIWKRLNTPKRKHQQPAPLLPLKLPIRSPGFCERGQSVASGTVEHSWL